MREIKFRAWDKEEKMWLKPAFNGVICIGYNKHICIVDNRPNARGGYTAQEPILLTWKEVADVETMQYTGLKDKNGKEIYEGDIVVYRDTSGSGRPREFTPRKVRWYRDSCDFNISRPMNGAEIEVIGNIYENPELLKEEDK